jgi:hypothetical protein
VNKQLSFGRDHFSAAQPLFELRPYFIGVDAEAGFEEAIGDGQGFVEGAVAREIAHEELIQPGFGDRLAGERQFESFREHAASISGRLLKL